MKSNKLLALFTKLFDIKIDEVRNTRDRMKVGLDKLRLLVRLVIEAVYIIFTVKPKCVACE